MWRKLSSQLRTLRLIRSTPKSNPTASAATSITSPSPAAFRSSVASFSRQFTTASENAVKKSVEDVMPIATGHEREELEAELQGRELLDINFPEGPFGTKVSVDFQVMIGASTHSLFLLLLSQCIVDQ
uniref:Cytochrome c oxidase subunit 5b-2, mitochondrial-like n=2 Tax=Nicotiana TaxID=4085 RepID=A0A1S4BCD1_TOBAC|nr:PREDICTED: cytochrome c oxidase subunit 5b-2, mitochondrial-like [Nicotiana sylvestris]XP_016486478.1 PREDICTED: cytochrome c oxidase subunit 5b-2, mitochondrial-like [Nicotiana tabacum]